MEADKHHGESISVMLTVFLIASASLVLSSCSPVGQSNPPGAQTANTQAEQNLRAAIHEAEKQHGPQGKELLKPLTALASYLTKNAQYGEALEVLGRVLAIETREYGSDHPEVAETIRLMADLHRNMGQYPKAELNYQKSLAILENVVGLDHSEGATTLNNLASLYYEQGQYAKAESLFHRSLAIREKILGPAHPDVAASLNGLAELHAFQGFYDLAEWLCQRSLAIREEALGINHPDFAESLHTLAVLYRVQGQLAAAEGLYRRSLVIRETTVGPDHPDVAKSLISLAGVSQALGDYANAQVLSLRSLAIREKALGTDHPDFAESLNSLAQLHEEQGQYADAERLFQRSLAILEKAVASDHVNVAMILNNLAVLYYKQGQYAKAEPLLQTSLSIYEQATNGLHPAVATILNNLASLYDKQGQHRKAEPFHDRSLAIREAVLGVDHPEVATSLNNLALNYFVQGEYREAEALYQRSLAILEKATGSDHINVAINLNNLAWLYEEMLQHENGVSIDVLPIRMRAFRIASGTNLPDALWPIQIGFLHTFAREGKTDLAIFFGKQAVNTIQSLRGNLSSQNPEAQRAFIQDKTSVYRDLADLLIDQGRLPEAQELLAMLKEEELYDFLTRSTTEENRKTTAGYNGIEESWQKRYQEISTQLGSIGSELDELDKKAKFGFSEEETTRREQLRSDRSVARQSFDKFLGDLMRELDSATAKRAGEVGERGLRNLRGLQTTLGSLGHGAVTLHYVMVESKLKMILTTPAIQIARESDISSKELNRKIQEFHALLSDPRKNPLPLAQELYKHLIRPVSEDLRQAKAQTLMVSLDGAMRYIPLAALHDGEKYLIEDYRIAIYTEAAKAKLKDDPSKQWSVAGLGLTQRIEGFDPLPSVRKEIEGIIKAGDRGVLPGEAHFDQEFNEQRFRQALDKRHPVLHIASHFVFKPGNESNSFLLLGDGKQLSLRVLRDDYSFGEIDLITLSACETAVGGGVDANGLEIEGFGALAQQQGAKSVIATLWKVADESTGILMQNLYRIRESARSTKIEALREAQLKFIRGGDVKAGAVDAQRGAARPDAGGWKTDAAKPYEHPYYWAPFILMGNWK